MKLRELSLLVVMTGLVWFQFINTRSAVDLLQSTADVLIIGPSQTIRAIVFG